MNTSERVIFLNSVNYILSLNDAWAIVKNLTLVLKNLETISEINLKSDFSFEWLTDDKKLKFIEIIIDFFKYSYENIKENIQNYNLIIKYENNENNNNNNLLLTNCKINTLLQFSLTTWHWASKSIYFCIKFHELNGLRILFKYINDNLLIFHLIEKLKQQTIKNNKYEKVYSNLALVYKSIAGTIHNLSKFEPNYRSIWHDLNAYQHLLNLANLFSDNKRKLDIDLLAYFSIVNLAKNETDLISLNELNNYILKVVDLIQLAGFDMATNESQLINRKLFKLTDRTDVKEIAIVTSKENTQWRLTELIEFMIRICDHCERFKLNTFENYTSLKLSMKQLLFNGNELEKEFILKLIWKLCLNSENTRLFLDNEKDVCSFIIGLSYNKLIQNVNILKYCDLILFLFETQQMVNNKSGVRVKDLHCVEIKTVKTTSSETNTRKMKF